MMSVYAYAITGSKHGPTAYVVERGLDILCTQDKASALALLKGGYQIKAHCGNGVLYNDWCLSARGRENCRAIRQICDLLDIENKWALIGVKVSTFYDDLLRKEAVHMYLDLWDYSKNTQTILITPKDRIADPVGFEEGQKTADQILDLLTVYSHVPQDSEGMIRYLEKTINKNKENEQK